MTDIPQPSDDEEAVVSDDDEEAVVSDADLRISTWAIAAFVLGILAALLSLVPVGGFFALMAVIAGHSARGEIKRGYRSGTGFAMIGLIIGYLVLVGVFVKNL